MTLTIGANVTVPVRNFIVIDNRTGKQSTRTTYKSRPAANRAADKLDLAYGAIRYSVKPV